MKAHVIFNTLYDEVDKLRFTDKEYEIFNNRVKEFSEEKLIELREERNSLAATRAVLQREFEEISVGRIKAVAKNDVMNKKAEEAVTKNLERLEDEIAEKDERLKEIDEKLQNPIALNETKEEFLNIIKMVGFKMRNGCPAEKDNLARILLLNIQINDKKEPIFTWKEPFNSLLKAKIVQCGLGDQT
ncbi:MAG: hypothetical protein Q4B65_01215 [Candidatus Saccharibacteria bacterium]|nr:hypothetical protein [Candidatus Saccharibacteria bacterium]